MGNRIRRNPYVGRELGQAFADLARRMHSLECHLANLQRQVGRPTPRLTETRRRMIQRHLDSIESHTRSFRAYEKTAREAWGRSTDMNELLGCNRR